MPKHMSKSTARKIFMDIFHIFVCWSNRILASCNEMYCLSETKTESTLFFVLLAVLIVLATPPSSVCFLKFISTSISSFNPYLHPKDFSSLTAYPLSITIIFAAVFKRIYMHSDVQHTNILL